MAFLLPRFISMEFQGKYLECTKGEGETKGLIEFSGEDALSPKARFEVEKALCSDELVHLKCCYRNKYLRRRSEKDDSIVAVAGEPEEDQSKWSCTLFRPRPLQSELESETLSSAPPPVISSPDTHNQFDFEIVAPHSEGGGPYYLFCAAIMQEKQGTEEAHDHSYLRISSGAATFTVRDPQAAVNLPQYITLKADNGKYLDQFDLESEKYLEFKVDEEDYMDAAILEVVKMGDGSIRLRHFRMVPPFLRFDGSFFKIDSSSANSNDLQTRFTPVKLGTTANSFGLRLRSNNWLCKRHSTGGITDGLGATSSQVEAAAVLEFEEAVGSRSVYEINYRMEDAKIYDFAPVTSVTKDVKNETQTTQGGELTFTYTETKSESWGNIDSWGVGVTVSMSARIPFVGSIDIETGAEYEGEYQWGETKETETEIATALQLEVPPMSRTQVTMIVSRGTLEVPFSYTQRDTLYNGHLIVTEVDGGIFTGVNTYVSYETTELSI